MGTGKKTVTVTDPETYALNKQVKLELLNNDTLLIVKKIKSRIIRKDAEKLVDMAGKIVNIRPDLKVGIKCSSNICSKSVALLQANNISIHIDPDD